MWAEVSFCHNSRIWRTDRRIFRAKYSAVKTTKTNSATNQHKHRWFSLVQQFLEWPKQLKSLQGLLWCHVYSQITRSRYDWWKRKVLSWRRNVDSDGAETTSSGSAIAFHISGAETLKVRLEMCGNRFFVPIPSHFDYVILIHITFNLKLKSHSHIFPSSKSHSHPAIQTRHHTMRKK